MDAMSYVNIFETKGLEYLLVISFLLGFFFFARWVCAGSRRLTPQTIPVSGELAQSRFGCVADFHCPYRTAVEHNEADDEIASEGVA